jgi:hypothetical protein
MPPHIGTLAKFLVDEAAQPLGARVDLIGRAKAIGERMLMQRSAGVIDASFAVDAGTGVELSALISSLAGTFVSAAIAQQSPQYPLHSVIGTVPQAGFAAEEIAERDPAPIEYLTNGVVQVTPSKVVAILVYSLETSRLRNFAVLAQTELEKAIGRGLDIAVLGRLAPGSAGGFSAGSSALTDLRTLTGMAVETTGQRLLFAASVDTFQRFATLAPGGLELFPMAGLIGVQEIKGVQCYPTDALSSGKLLAIDPSGVTCSINAVEMSATTEAALDISAMPDMPTTLGSLFQGGNVALMATARFSCVQLRSENVSAECTSIGWTEA